MEIDKDYLRFSRWWKESQRAFHCGQFDDRQIAYAAWREGQKGVISMVSPTAYYVNTDNPLCPCVTTRQVYSLGTRDFCTQCGKPLP